jgi:hypothetical protein
MQLEVVRSIVAALNDPTNGVLAKLVSLPKDVGDTVTSDVLVVDGTEDDALAKGEQITRGDAELMLLVVPDGPTITQQSAGGSCAHGITPVSITAVHRGNGTPAKKVQDISYLLRACVLTVHWYFFQLRGDDGARVRNFVTLTRCLGLQYGLTQDDGLGALGAVVFSIESLDKRAQRTV